MDSRVNDILPVKKQRESNMELLRIVAMLLVMVVHANFRALPVPTAHEIIAEPTSKFLMFFTEAVSVIAVNVFVLMSGWFGIRPKAKRLGELLFQVLFFGLFGIVVCWVFAPDRLLTTPQYGSAISRLFMCGETDYWFVKTYIALYLISPVLNAFIEKASQRQFATVLIAFFVFQCAYDWLSNATKWMASGYSLTSFAWFYMLARYMRLYPVKLWQKGKWFDACVYACYVAILTIAMFFIKKNGLRGGILYFYSCPLVILGAIHFMLFFTKLPPFSNKIVNWVAISSFAIYLTHSSNFIGGFYDKWILGWFMTMSRGEFIGCTSLLIAAVFVGSILVDKVRIALWQGLILCCDKIKNKNK